MSYKRPYIFRATLPEISHFAEEIVESLNTHQIESIRDLRNYRGVQITPRARGLENGGYVQIDSENSFSPSRIEYYARETKKTNGAKQKVRWVFGIYFGKKEVIMQTLCRQDIPGFTRREVRKNNPKYNLLKTGQTKVIEDVSIRAIKSELEAIAQLATG